jgi:hypothetical protein
MTTIADDKKRALRSGITATTVMGCIFLFGGAGFGVFTGNATAVVLAGATLLALAAFFEYANR